MDNLLTALIAAAALVAGAVAGPLIAGWFSRKQVPAQTAQNRRMNAETDTLVASNLTAEIQRLDGELSEVRDEVKALRVELEKRPTRIELLDDNGKLRQQLLDLGETPKTG